MQPLSPPEQLIETLILTQLEQNVYIVGVLEEVLELHHVLMLDRSVYFDLAHELLFGSGFCE